MTCTSVDQTDILLLNALQDDIPLVPDPWEIIGKQIGISEKEVLVRLTRMEKAGILRGIDPILESSKRKKGVSTLIAFQVPEDEISTVAAVVNEYPEVSHNFRRECEYNLWFTLTADSPDRISEITDEILSRTGMDPAALLNLATVRRYKIDVKFPLLQKEHGVSNGSC